MNPETKTELEKLKTELEKLLVPVMEWLSKNAHPHVKIIVDSECSEMMEGLTAIRRESRE
jgi:hypothetical protein